MITKTPIAPSDPVSRVGLQKQERLAVLLKSYGSVLVAYSGGVDSTYLAEVAFRTLGERALIVTAQSPSMAAVEFDFAAKLARQRGWRYRVVQTRETEDARWLCNDSERCYFCKMELFSVLGPLARNEGIAYIAYGAIPDDTSDVRPGRRAAGECAVLAPLVEIGLTKPEIRMLSRSLQLPTWDKPATACLASRIPTGTAITATKLDLVAHGEASLSAYGFRGHRVRHHGSLARIEIQPEDWSRISDPGLRRRIVTSLRSLGYTYVTIDLAGYRPAGLNQCPPSAG